MKLRTIKSHTTSFHVPNCYPPLEALTDDQLKAELFQLAKSGAPRPKANTELGKALKRFTTK